MSSANNILVRLMGNIQKEVLTEQIKNRFGLDISFGPPTILYKETIKGNTIGYGHYEPKGHYAEVRLDIKSIDLNSGIVAKSTCHLDDLEKRYQNLILTHILEKEHLGVLTGSPLTDVAITLTHARSYLDETGGGDFRQATYRAIRQGLMKAESVLLEPWYNFIITLPSEFIGRAMSDIQRFYGDFNPPQINTEGNSVLEGKVPVANFLDYPITLTAYTKGLGSISIKPAGYFPCHNADEVIKSEAYEPERDLDNTPNSIFFTHGAGYEVKWQDVDATRHIKD